MITTALTDAKEGPWILNCNYCMWNTLEIGIKFDKSMNIRAQLDKIENGGGERRPSKVPEPDRKSSLSREPFSPLAKQENSDPMNKVEAPPPSDPTSRFNALRSFYKDQLAASAASDPALTNSGAAFAYSSPSSLDRLMNLYTNTGTSMKKTNQKPTIMREALTPFEGLTLSTQLGVVSAFEPEPYTSTISPSQRLTRELEKKFSDRQIIIIASRRILPRPKRSNRSRTNQTQKRPRSRTLTAVHDAMLADIVYPVEIVGKRVRTKEDGSKVLKVILDEKERGGVDYRLDTYGEVYKKLTGRGVGFEFPMSGGQEY